MGLCVHVCVSSTCLDILLVAIVSDGACKYNYKFRIFCVCGVFY